jgi:TRAP-type C4-dicarboxylate transport system permease small subunit
MSVVHPKFSRVFEYVASLALIVAFVIFMWAGWRYNLQLSSLPTRDVSSCPSLAGKYVLTSVKGTMQCVEAGAAHRFKQADEIGQIALAVGAVCFLSLFLIQRRQKRIKNASN